MNVRETLRVTLVQSTLHWENPEANRRHFDTLLAEVGYADLILLPEMFSTGFSMDAARLHETMEGPSVQWIKKTAAASNAVVSGSLIIGEAGHYFNRLIWCTPEGEIHTYDKRHLFRMAGEEKIFTPGKERLLVTLHGWKICPLICYDLRFPVWSRNVEENYDLLLYTANWPEVRRHPWKTLLTARAIENQCYVAGVNRVGPDGNGINHSGDSALLDPKGEIIEAPEPYNTECVTATLSYAALKEFREKFPVSRDADAFEISL